MLERTLKTARLILGCAVLFSLVIFFCSLTRAVRRVDDAVFEFQRAGSELHVLAGNLNGAVYETRLNLGDELVKINALTGEMQAGIPRAQKGIFYLWKHADRTLGHVDQASSDWREQQQQITDKTVKLIDATHAQVELTGPFLRSWTEVGNQTSARLLQTQPLLANLTTVTEHAAGITGDLEIVQHRYFFPDKPTPKWKRVLNGIEGATKIGEFGYYWTNMR